MYFFDTIKAYSHLYPIKPSKIKGNAPKLRVLYVDSWIALPLLKHELIHELNGLVKPFGK